jgi:hypothetical protein
LEVVGDTPLPLYSSSSPLVLSRRPLVKETKNTRIATALATTQLPPHPFPFVMIAPTSSSPSNPLLFERSTGPFDLSLWRNPSSEYRGAPFWSWNNKLRPEQLLRQLDFMQEMGMGGAHMHPRTGLDTPYMGEEYMGIMKTIVERCKEKGMLACLYDVGQSVSS